MRHAPVGSCTCHVTGCHVCLMCPCRTHPGTFTQVHSRALLAPRLLLYGVAANHVGCSQSYWWVTVLTPKLCSKAPCVVAHDEGGSVSRPPILKLRYRVMGRKEGPIPIVRPFRTIAHAGSRPGALTPRQAATKRKHRTLPWLLWLSPLAPAGPLCISIYPPTGGRTRAVLPSGAVSGSGSALPSEGSSPPHV